MHSQLSLAQNLLTRLYTRLVSVGVWRSLKPRALPS